MRKILLCLLAVIVVSSISIAQMKLHLPPEIGGEDSGPINKLVLNKEEVSSDNLTVNLPADESKLIPGSFIVGLLGDVTFPFGEAFKNYAGTAWSIHGMGGYVLDPIMVALKVGYIRFGEVETDFSSLAKSSQYEIFTAYNTQVVLALVALLTLSGLDPICPTPSCLSPITLAGFEPFISFGICLILKQYIQRYALNMIATKTTGTLQNGDTFEDNSTIFAITPSIGTFYQVSDDIRLILSADYYYLFDEADIGAANINYLSLTFGAAYSFL
ncbi:MAG: hypothetical protein HKM87_06030 [Ignavibacteriaceae bacterium]|nr:hypothetical protein [Ignavibacteriaceae bacterium]